MSSAVFPAYDYCLIEKQAEKRDYKQLECEQPLGMVVWVSKSSEANTEKKWQEKMPVSSWPFHSL